MRHDGSGDIVVCGHLCLDIIPGFPAVAGDHGLVPSRAPFPGGRAGHFHGRRGLERRAFLVPPGPSGPPGGKDRQRPAGQAHRGKGAGPGRKASPAAWPSRQGEVTSYTIVLNPRGSTGSSCTARARTTPSPTTMFQTTSWRMPRSSTSAIRRS